MPCRSDYLAASGQELESKRVCQFLTYLLTETNEEPPEWVAKAADDYYGNVSRLDEATRLLCEFIRSLPTEITEKLIYDPHNKTARNLADWWERHQEWDNRRTKEEEQARKTAHLKERALKKLTPEEMKAIGLLPQDWKPDTTN
jgi:hypothetical protein